MSICSSISSSLRGRLTSSLCAQPTCAGAGWTWIAAERQSSFERPRPLISGPGSSHIIISQAAASATMAGAGIFSTPRTRPFRLIHLILSLSSHLARTTNSSVTNFRPYRSSLCLYDTFQRTPSLFTSRPAPSPTLSIASTSRSNESTLNICHHLLQFARL